MTFWTFVCRRISRNKRSWCLEANLPGSYCSRAVQWLNRTYENWPTRALRERFLPTTYTTTWKIYQVTWYTENVNLICSLIACFSITLKTEKVVMNLSPEVEKIYAFTTCLLLVSRRWICTSLRPPLYALLLIAAAGSLLPVPRRHYSLHQLEGWKSFLSLLPSLKTHIHSNMREGLLVFHCFPRASELL